MLHRIEIIFLCLLVGEILQSPHAKLLLQIKTNLYFFGVLEGVSLYQIDRHEQTSTTILIETCEKYRRLPISLKTRPDHTH